jgi:heme exporter protein D
MEQLRDFLTMGDYGAYVWPAYGVSALVLGWLLVSSLRRLRGLERTLAEQGIAAPGGGRRRRDDASKEETAR